MADHPELAQQLEDCLAGIEFVHRAARPATGMPTRLGDFQIIREIGRGGMGVVYEAEQISLKRKVALKVLRFGVTTDAEVMQRFQREAETVAHLHHTNIVPIHAVGCEQGVHYYAMQFIEGQSLAAVLNDASRSAVTSGNSEFKQIVGWSLQAAEALAHAHQRGVIHRDIKPSNLILDPEGTVWLTDFGLAKRADEVTMTAAGVVMGTPRYMSPEQAAAAKQPIDHRTDIYPSAHAEQREQEVILADVLSKLSDDHREVIILRNLEGLSHEEVAQRMGRTVGAVRMLWVRALTQLRQAFADGG